MKFIRHAFFGRKTGAGTRPLLKFDKLGRVRHVVMKKIGGAIIYAAKARSPIRTRIGMQMKKQIDQGIGSGLKEIKRSHKTSHKSMNFISMDKRSQIEQALKHAFK